MKAVLLLVSMGWFLQGLGQQDYFVYIQSEKNQPFYVMLNEKNYSSSSVGHLVLSKLKDSAYTLTIGFPQNQFPEQEFTIRIGKKDKGFELKNLGDKGWALFDIHTLELISPYKKAGSGGGAGYSLIKKDDGFARLMAGVVNDTAVLYTVVMDKQPETLTAAIRSDTTTTSATVQATNINADSSIAKNAVITVPDTTVSIKETVKVKEEPVKQADEPKKITADTLVAKQPVQDLPKEDTAAKAAPLPVITVVSRQATDTGYHMLVVDDIKDSIGIFIPADKEPVAEKNAEVKPEPKVTEPARQQPVKEDSMKVAKDTMVSAAPVIKDTAVKDTAGLTSNTPKNEKKLVMVNSDCRNFATANDVDKLRVKMVKERDTEGKIGAAKKVFKTRCLSAQQIKALSELFPTDEDKYKFFEVAYPFVSDTSNFKELVSLFTDPVFAQRFRMLVRIN